MREKAQDARRNEVKRLVGWLKEHRSLATRFDKRAGSFLAMVKLGCIRHLQRAASPHRAYQSPSPDAISGPLVDPVSGMVKTF